jgi:hypothetical protein
MHLLTVGADLERLPAEIGQTRQGPHQPATYFANFNKGQINGHIFRYIVVMPTGLEEILGKLPDT